MLDEDGGKTLDWKQSCIPLNIERFNGWGDRSV